MECDRKWIPRARRILPVTHSPQGQRAWWITRMKRLLLSPSHFFRKSCKQHQSSQKQNNLSISVHAFSVSRYKPQYVRHESTAKKCRQSWSMESQHPQNPDYRRKTWSILQSVKSVSAFVCIPSHFHIWSIKVTASSSSGWSTMLNLVRNSCKQH